jgi:hypothetical protein
MFHKHMILVKNVEGWRLSGGWEFLRGDYSGIRVLLFQSPQVLFSTLLPFN